MSANDLTGQTFTRLTVVERAANYVAPSGVQRARWVCRCTCGTTVVVLASSLQRGATLSCGCLRLEQATERASRMGAANRRSSITYKGAHDRVRRERGRASEQACACGKSARDWSYDGSDANELTGAVQLPSGRTIQAPYSLDPSHYQPRCRSCHVKADLFTRMIDPAAVTS